MKALTIGVAGIALPLALAAAAVLISSGVGASTPVAPLPAGQEHRESGPSLSPTPSQSDEPSESPSTPESPSSTPTVDDHGDRCSEPEHSNDPNCTSDGGGSGGSSKTPGDDGSNGSSSSSSDGHGSGGGGDD